MYEDLEPSTTRTEYHRYVCFSFFLPEFERDHIEVQKSTSGELFITMERPLGYDHRWIRFRRHTELEGIYNVAQCSAGFGIGNLRVRVPKTISPVEEEDHATIKSTITTVAAPESREPKLVVASILGEEVVAAATIPPPSEVKEEKRDCIAPAVVSNKETAEQCGEIAKIAPLEENERARSLVNRVVESGRKLEETFRELESLTSDSIEKNGKVNWKSMKKKPGPKNGSCFGNPKDREKTSCVEDDKSQTTALTIADGDATMNRVSPSPAAFTTEIQTTQTLVPINPEIHSMRVKLSIGIDRRREAKAALVFHLDHPNRRSRTASGDAITVGRKNSATWEPPAIRLEDFSLPSTGKEKGSRAAAPAVRGATNPEASEPSPPRKELLEKRDGGSEPLRASRAKKSELWTDEEEPKAGQELDRTHSRSVVRSSPEMEVTTAGDDGEGEDERGGWRLGSSSHEP
ncbi:unnamed protein product [Linum trigynum]